MPSVAAFSQQVAINLVTTALASHSPAPCLLKAMSLMMVCMKPSSGLGYETVGCSPARQTSYVLTAVSLKSGVFYRCRDHDLSKRRELLNDKASQTGRLYSSVKNAQPIHGGRTVKCSVSWIQSSLPSAHIHYSIAWTHNAHCPLLRFTTVLHGHTALTFTTV